MGKLSQDSSGDDNWLLYIVSFLSCLFGLGLGIALPSLSPLTVALGGSELEAGLVIGIWGLTYVSLSIPAGIVADKIGAGRIAAIGMMGNSLTAAIYLVSVDPSTLVLGRLLQGVFESLIWSGIFGLIASIYYDKRIKALGFLSGTMLLGFSVGPAIGGLMSASLGLRSTFIPYMLLSVLSGLGLSFISRRIKLPSKEKVTSRFDLGVLDIVVFLVILPYLLIVFTFGVFDSVLQTFYPKIVGRWGSEEVGGLLLTAYYLSILTSQLSLRYTARVVEHRFYTPLSFLSSLLLVKAFLSIPFRNPTTLLSVWIYIGFVIGTNVVKIQAFLSGKFRSRSSTAMGMYNTSWGLGYILGAPIAALVSSYVNIFVFIQVLLGASFLLSLYYIFIR